MHTRNPAVDVPNTLPFAPGRPMGIFILVLMSGLVLIRYGMALDSWWCCDDPQILLHALRFEPLSYFFEPAAWQALIPYSLTPWLSLTYDLDHGLFGMRPEYFYLHNLVVIGLCGWLLYLLARPWTGQFYAITTGLFFLLGAPVALASQQLMVRHYSEGMLFFLLALLLSRHAVQQQRLLSSLAAGLAFAIAASAKEIWLPLGLLAFLMPIGNWRERLRCNLPILAVMLLYVPWRYYMLGELLGGYTPAASLQAESRLLPFATALQQAPEHFWQHPAIAAGALLLLALGAIFKHPRPCLRALPWLLALLTGLLAPLYPLIPTPGLGPGSERYFIASWAAIAFLTGLLGFLTTQDRGRLVRIAAPLLLLALGVDTWQRATHILEQQREQQARYRAIGHSLATLDADTVILGDAGLPSWYTQGIIDLRPAMGNRAAPPQLIGDMVWLEGLPHLAWRYLSYDTERQVLADISDEIDSRRQAWRAKLRSIPMSIHFQYDEQAGAMFWQLSTKETTGSFALIDKNGTMPLPEQGQLRMLPPKPGTCFRIRFQSHEGWHAYGPPMNLPSTGEHRKIDWQGDTESFQTRGTSNCPQVTPS